MNSHTNKSKQKRELENIEELINLGILDSSRLLKKKGE